MTAPCRGLLGEGCEEGDSVDELELYEEGGEEGGRLAFLRAFSWP